MPINGHMPQFARHSTCSFNDLAIDNHAAANAGADSQIHYIAAPTSCSKHIFAQARCVRVIFNENRNVKMLYEEIARGTRSQPGKLGGARITPVL